jgi:hypothetical protein
MACQEQTSSSLLRSNAMQEMHVLQPISQSLPIGAVLAEWLIRVSKHTG